MLRTCGIWDLDQQLLLKDLKMDLRGNGRRKVLAMGKIGTGKSTLCNVLAGREPDADLFPVSSDAVSCTQNTKFADLLLMLH